MQLSTAGEIAVLVVVVAAGCADRATTEASLRGHRDPTARVVSPGVETTVEQRDLTVSGRWRADAVTGATPVMAAPDAFTRATEFEETRHEATIDADWRAGGRQSWAASLRASRESDYAAYGASASTTRDLFDDHATLSLGASLGHDRIGRADVRAFSKRLWTGATTLEFSRVLSPELVAHVSWNLEGRAGYQANPYRLVPIFEGGSGRPTVVVPERHPEGRLRNAVEPLIAWSLDETLFVHGSYRFYVDDWGIRSHTGRAELWGSWFADRFRGRLRLRAYLQNDADFYRARYREIEPYRTGDYRLSRMNSLSAGIRFDLRPPLPGTIHPKLSTSYDATLYQFANYAPRDSMVAHSWGLNLTMEWK